MTMNFAEEYNRMKEIYSENFETSSNMDLNDDEAEFFMSYFDVSIINGHFIVNGVPTPFLVLPCVGTEGTSGILKIKHTGDDYWLGFESYVRNKTFDAVINEFSNRIIPLSSLAAMQEIYDSACQFTW